MNFKNAFIQDAHYFLLNGKNLPEHIIVNEEVQTAELLIIYDISEQQKAKEDTEIKLNKLETALLKFGITVQSIQFSTISKKEFYNIQKLYQPKIIVLFGVSYPQLSLNITAQNSHHIYFAGIDLYENPSFETISDSQKTMFWNMIKKRLE